MIDVLWVLVGIIIGATGGILAISLISASKFEDGEREIQDLRIQRELLKKEIFRLSKPNRGKPQPRKKRVRQNYKQGNPKISKTK